MEREYDVAVVGGGASGLMAAVFSARGGARTVVLEKNKKPGRKLSATGNGRCNFSNQSLDPSFYRTDFPEGIRTPLAAFTKAQTVGFFSELGLMAHERNGYLYPLSDQATSVLEILLMELRRLRVHMFCGDAVQTVSRENGVFLLRTAKHLYRVKKVILAAGSLAAPQLGASDFGYETARAFGHRIVPVVPALVPLRSDAPCFQALKGVRANAAVTLRLNGEASACDRGEVQFTERGISGIPAFQVSRFASRALNAGLYAAEGREEPHPGHAEASLDFLPGLSLSETEAFLLRIALGDGKRYAEQLPVGFLQAKLIPTLMEHAKIPRGTYAQDLDKTAISRLARSIKRFTVPVTGTMGFDHAQVCAGGVDLSEVDLTAMESKLTPGLYLSGELLDADGPCGGYNLQWAWSTGQVAGDHAARSLKSGK